MSETLRVAINCELAPGTQAGGTQSAVIGLVRALGELDGPEEYVLICHPRNRDWIEPVAGANTRLLDRTPAKPTAGRALAGRIAEWLQSPADRAWPPPPCSDGFYESLGAHVIHWPWQHFVVTALPSVFNPHDLLHLHHPQFFSAAHIAAREALYPVACRLAHTVVAGSEWTQQDLLRRYALHPSRIQIVPWAPPIQASAPSDPSSIARVRAAHALPGRFAFYPAVTWPHKNHQRLLAAMAGLRDRRGLRVDLVCSGHREPHHATAIEAEVARLGLEGQVRFLGQVSAADLRAVFRAAEFVFVPTLFEAASGPVFEAWHEDVPVACSTVTSLPQQVGDAALLFDPWKVESIADALARMATEATLRETLRGAGRRRLADFPWERTARAYRAVYRRAAGRSLGAEDEALLAWDWMRDSRPRS